MQKEALIAVKSFKEEGVFGNSEGTFQVMRKGVPAFIHGISRRF